MPICSTISSSHAINCGTIVNQGLDQSTIISFHSNGYIIIFFHVVCVRVMSHFFVLNLTSHRNLPFSYHGVKSHKFIFTLCSFEATSAFGSRRSNTSSRLSGSFISIGFIMRFHCEFVNHIPPSCTSIDCMIGWIAYGHWIIEFKEIFISFAMDHSVINVIGLISNDCKTIHVSTTSQSSSIHWDTSIRYGSGV